MAGDRTRIDTIGICRKAGKLIAGFDAVVGEMKKADGKVAGVVITRDLSEKSRKEINFHCGKFGKSVSVINADMTEIERVLGKKTGIMAILDEGLYNSITS